MPRKPSPPKKQPNPKPQAEARRKRIVEAVAEKHKSVSEAARDEGISREQASRLVNSPQSRIEIAAMLDRRYQRADAMLDKLLDRIDNTLDAEKTVVVQHSEKDGDKVTRHSEVLNLGPDYFARMAAGKRLIELLTAGRPVPKIVPREESKGISLEELTRWAEILQAKKA